MLHSLNNAIAYEILLGVLMVRSERADINCNCHPYYQENKQ